MTKILEKLSLVPNTAGVYIMKDKNGNVIYIGKAKNLPNRLANYFKNKVHDAKTTAMVTRVCDFDYFVCRTENDALGLEANLIKRYKPHYNILLKDNKTFPYIRIHENKIEITRQVHKKGKYFGPYYNGIWASGLLDTIYDIFDVRDKSDDETILKIKDFLRGEREFEARETLTDKMQRASELQQFELAIRYRNGLMFLDKLGERTVTNVGRDLNCDVFGYASSVDVFVVSVITVRGGKMIGVQNFSAMNASPKCDEEKLEEFMGQYYLENIKPEEIITEAKIGHKKNLLDMAYKNAQEYIDTSIEKIKHKEQFTVGACGELQRILGMGTLPKRIECFDNSHMGGEDVVAGMVVFTNGMEDKKEYRKFKLRHTSSGSDDYSGAKRGHMRSGSDDYQSMREVISRRLKRRDWQRPDLIILDGGKGQLSSVIDLFPNDICVIAFSENDEIFTSQSGEPLTLEKRSYALRLLQRVRDEAHRYANLYRNILQKKRVKV